MSGIHPSFFHNDRSSMTFLSELLRAEEISFLYFPACAGTTFLSPRPCRYLTAFSADSILAALEENPRAAAP